MSVSPSTYTFTFLVYSSANPAVIVTATATIPIPSPPDYSSGLLTIYKGGGFWYTSGGVLTFVPWGMVTSVSAQ
jgi:hypothetical protein